MGRLINKTQLYIVVPFETISILSTATLIIILLMRPDLRRRQLCRIIMMQAVADFIYSTGSTASIFTLSCGPLLNKYLFIAVAFSSVWVAVLAFHLSAQASGYWIAAEKWGWRYQAFALLSMIFFFCVTFGSTNWRFGACFAADPGGVELNDRLAFGLVFSTVLWIAACVIYTRYWRGTRLYSSRFMLIYVVCWLPQIAWFVSQSAGVSDSVLNSPIWNTVILIFFGSVGTANVVAYGTMPPEFVLYRFYYSLKFGTKNADSRTRWCCGFLTQSANNNTQSIYSDNTNLRQGLLSAELNLKRPMLFDAAVDSFLFAMIRKHGPEYDGFVIPPSSLIMKTPLGSGTFGTVYSGKYNSVNVAIKEMHCGLRSDYTVDKPKYITELLHEAAMLTRARNRHVVTFVGLTLGLRGRLLLVMELCAFKLRDYLNTDSVCATARNRDKVRLRCCAEICDGLSYLHDRLRVVHRDIKMDNIFTSQKGITKIGDLGTACFQTRLDASTKTTGTPSYLAPEGFPQARFKIAKNFADRIDIYAAAVTICEIFSGEIPYEKIRFFKISELFNSVAEGLRPSTKGVPEPIAELCHQGWSFFAANRPSATELAKQLRGILSLTEWHEIRNSIKKKAKEDLQESEL